MVHGLAHFSTIYRIIWDLTAENECISKKGPLKLKVIHLLRRLERIERDLEELDGMLSGLPMDREYSLRLRDSLIEESSRLKDFKQKILTQRVISDNPSAIESTENADSPESSEVSIQIPEKGSASNGKPRPKTQRKAPPAAARTEKKEKKEEKPAFEFRFE